MTIETLKSEVAKLSRLEKLKFMCFLAELLSEEERENLLSEEEKEILLRRQDEIKSGKVKTIPASEVKTKLEKKYGLQSK